MQKNSNNNYLWFLMARALSNEASAQERAMLDEELKGDAELLQQFELLKRMWNANARLAGKNADAGDDEEEKKHISDILKKIRENEEATGETPVAEMTFVKRDFKRRFMFYAAAVILFFTAGAAWYRYSGNEALTSVSNLVAENGSKTRTILPDGSTVLLNAGSHISFIRDFSGKTREVTLEGEAYFDVVKQPERPFIVHVGAYDIKVLGTAFNVKSYPSDKTIETTLLRGLVQVSRHDKPGNKPVFLHPNEKIILEKPSSETAETKNTNHSAANVENETFNIEKLDSVLTDKDRIETAWVYNRLEFKDEEFATLAEKLDRWYNVNIVFDDAKVEQLNFTGSFENETIEEALTALQKAAFFNYSMSGKDIHIGRKLRK